MSATATEEELRQLEEAKEAVRECYSRDRLLGRVCDIVEGLPTGSDADAVERRNADSRRQLA